MQCGTYTLKPLVVCSNWLKSLNCEWLESRKFKTSEKVVNNWSLDKTPVNVITPQNPCGGVLACKVKLQATRRFNHSNRNRSKFSGNIGGQFAGDFLERTC